MKRISCLILVIISCNLLYAGPGLSSPDFLMKEDSAPVKEVIMDIVASDGAKLKATYYTSGKPGPGMLLLHQCNMDRESWKQLATVLAQRGINVLTFDYRGYGETLSSGET